MKTLEQKRRFGGQIRATHHQPGRVPTQVYPDNTRILSAPVTGETPLQRVDGGELYYWLTCQILWHPVQRGELYHLCLN